MSIHQQCCLNKHILANHHGAGYNNVNRNKEVPILSIFGMDDKSLEGYVLLSAKQEGIFAGLIENLLKDNDILCTIRDSSPGGFLQSLTGGTKIGGVDIYVAEDQLDEAKTLMDAYVNGESTPIEDEE